MESSSMMSRDSKRTRRLPPDSRSREVLSSTSDHSTPHGVTALGNAPMPQSISQSGSGAQTQIMPSVGGITRETKTNGESRLARGLALYSRILHHVSPSRVIQEDRNYKIGLCHMPGKCAKAVGSGGGTACANYCVA